MKIRELKIGSHVGMKAPDYLVGSLNETKSYRANAMMIFTGAPQNTLRKPLSQLKITEFQAGLKAEGIPLANVIVHAPYLINLANSLKPATFEQSIKLLKTEIERTAAIGAEILVLHPGSAVGATKQQALEQLVKGLDAVCSPEMTVKIALETMAGKGSEIGATFEELAYVLNHVKYPELIGICWDTCHLYDAGYDIKTDLAGVMQQFEALISLDKILAIHLNDSLQGLNSHKDRHANLGMGKLGFEALLKLIYHPAFKNKVQVLETTYINGQAPYQVEIAMIDQKQFNHAALAALAKVKS